jgi:hypothetical protein
MFKWVHLPTIGGGYVIQKSVAVGWRSYMPLEPSDLGVNSRR